MGKTNDILIKIKRESLSGSQYWLMYASIYNLQSGSTKPRKSNFKLCGSISCPDLDNRRYGDIAVHDDVSNWSIHFFSMTFYSLFCIRVQNLQPQTRFLSKNFLRMRILIFTNLKFFILSIVFLESGLNLRVAQTLFKYRIKRHVLCF